MKKLFMYLVAAAMLLNFNSCEKEASLMKVLPIPTPSMNWGATEGTIEKEMKNLGYRFEEEDSGKEESGLSFSYDHGRYFVYCGFFYSEYSYFFIVLRKSDANDVVDWLDKNYTEEGYNKVYFELRDEYGQAYLYKSKDGKSWAYVGVSNQESYVYWGSMKYGGELYEQILADMR